MSKYSVSEVNIVTITIYRFVLLQQILQLINITTWINSASYYVNNS